MQSTWTSDELDRIGAADELLLSSARADGSLRHPVTIWMVRVGDVLYVRAVGGRQSPWFRRAHDSGTGHLSAAGIERDIAITDADADESVAAEIDATFVTKYGHYPRTFVDAVLTPQAQAATLVLHPLTSSS